MIASSIFSIDPLKTLNVTPLQESHLGFIQGIPNEVLVHRTQQMLFYFASFNLEI
jgi:hypothetical protein